MNWKEIYQHLKNSEFDIYAPGQHEGICLAPYLVLKNNGAQVVMSRNIQEYEVLIYVPANKYSTFEELVASVKQCMNGLYPALKLVDDQQPHYPDTDIKAFMTSLVYQTQKIETVNRV